MENGQKKRFAIYELKKDESGENTGALKVLFEAADVENVILNGFDYIENCVDLNESEGYFFMICLDDGKPVAVFSKDKAGWGVKDMQ